MKLLGIYKDIGELIHKGIRVYGWWVYEYVGYMGNNRIYVLEDEDSSVYICRLNERLNTLESYDIEEEEWFEVRL